LKNPERLHHLDSFSHLTALQLHQLAECLTSRKFAAGTTIYREGEPPTAFYLVDEGAVRICRMTPFGPFELAALKPGDLFGESGFIDGANFSGDAESSADSTLAVFDAISVAARCRADRKFEIALLWTLWKSLSQKLRTANNRLTRFFSIDAQRVDTTPASASRAVLEGDFDMAHRLGLFREQKLSEMEINFLGSLSREHHFEPGALIFSEGEPGEKMYVVADGSVVISKTIPGIGEEALAFLERGDYFGEMSLIENQPRSADARAHPDTGTTVLALPREVVSGLLNIERVSSARLLLLKILSGMVAKRLHELNEKLVGWFLLSGGDLDSGGDYSSES
jgi:CRP-like cAMP-binding protein